MSTIEDILSEDEMREQATGNCYESAANYIIDHPGDEVFLVHGRPILQGGEFQGVEYGHAWIEYIENDIHMVLDTESGMRIPKALYYMFGQIDYDKSVIYTRQQALEKLTEEGTYGPWN
jgi:hypothetical protein